jgi:CheY-like chemotaxis protein
MSVDGRKVVLVVDDEKSIADTLALILRKSGYDTSVAYDAAGALRKCEEFQPDVVITDVVMPGMNGIELALRVRQQHPQCKVLLFSGMAGSRDLLAEHPDGDGFQLLAKPIHPAELLAKLKD